MAARTRQEQGSTVCLFTFYCAYRTLGRKAKTRGISCPKRIVGKKAGGNLEESAPTGEGLTPDFHRFYEAEHFLQSGKGVIASLGHCLSRSTEGICVYILRDPVEDTVGNDSRLGENSVNFFRAARPSLKEAT